MRASSIPGLRQAATWLIAAALPVAASAQGLSRPVLGYVFEQAGKSIRAIAGVPGAAVLDESLPNASKLQAAFPAPGRAFAIASTLESPQASVIRWDASQPILSVVEEALTGPSLVAFTAGEFAAVFYKEHGRVQLWKGLPDAPQVTQTVESGDIQALAISDDGALVALAGPAGITLIDGSGTRIAASGDFSALAFLRGSRHLLGAEPSLDRVVRIDTSEGGLSEFAMAHKPAAIAVSQDGRHIAIAGAEGSLVLVDATGSDPAVLDWDRSAQSASQLRGDAVFLLSADDGSHWVLDVHDSLPRLVFAGGSR